MWSARFTSVFISFLLLFAIGCSSSSDNTEPPINDNLLMSALSRTTAPDVSEADLAAAVSGNTDFALKAFPQLEADPGTNIVFSPYSITLAVALTSAGAKEATLSGKETAMSFTLPQERLPRRSTSLISSSRRRRPALFIRTVLDHRSLTS